MGRACRSMAQIACTRCKETKRMKKKESMGDVVERNYVTPYFPQFVKITGLARTVANA
jgi:hypothetical protein